MQLILSEGPGSICEIDNFYVGSLRLAWNRQRKQGIHSFESKGPTAGKCRVHLGTLGYPGEGRTTSTWGQ